MRRKLGIFLARFSYGEIIIQEVMPAIKKRNIHKIRRGRRMYSLEKPSTLEQYDKVY